jgi:single-strand DNA-binding protein
MTQQTAEPAVLNEVRLRGRWQGAEERELPSGDLVVTARLVVSRPAGGVDTIDCAVWAAGLRRRALGWDAGADVELTGSLRRRFWRTPQGAASRYEVEVTQARRVRPATGTTRAAR